MSLLCGAPAITRVDKNHVDLQKVLEKYIWKKLLPLQFGPVKSALIRKSRYIVDINWEYVPKTSVTDNSRPLTLDEDVPVVLHHAEFENTSGKEQKFTFSTTKETKAISSFNFTESYSISNKITIGIKLPCETTLGAEISGSYTLTDSRTQTFESRLQWDMHSEITVNDEMTANASMNVFENVRERPITVTTTFEFAKSDQRLPFVVRHKKTGSILLVGDVLSLKQPFEYFYEKRVKGGQMPRMLSFNKEVAKTQGDPKVVRQNRCDDVIVIKMNGVSRTTAWKDHKIEVHKTER